MVLNRILTTKELGVGMNVITSAVEKSYALAMFLIIFPKIKR